MNEKLETATSYWKYVFIAVILTAIFLFLPFAIEYIIKNGLYRPNSFEDEIWFSFIGSYIGAIITVTIFGATVMLNRHDINSAIERNKRNSQINYELKIAEKIYRFLLLSDYPLQSPDTELVGLRKLLEDLIVIRVYIKQNLSNQDLQIAELSTARKNFYNIASVQHILMEIDISTNMSQISNEKNREKYSQFILNIIGNRNEYAEELTVQYEKYIKLLIKEIS